MGLATPRPGAYPLQEHHDLLSAYHCKCGPRDKLRPIQNSVSGSPSSAALWPDLFMRISGFEGAWLHRMLKKSVEAFSVEAPLLQQGLSLIHISEPTRPY